MRDVTTVGGRIGAALLLSSVIAACGGGGGVSKAEIIKRGNAVCRRVTDQVLAGPRPSDSADPLSPYATSADWIGAARNIELFLSVLREERDGFTALGRPDADAAAFRQLVAYLEVEYDAGLQLDRAAHSRDRRAFIAASNSSDIAEGKWLTLADKFGFTDCTTNGL